MKISEVFRKRALCGVAIFCITAIATVGALSIGGNEEENTPDSLVDLNATDEPGNAQVADEGQDAPDVQNPDIQVGDNTENPEETTTPGIQTGDNTEKPEDADTPDIQVGDITGTPEDTQVADVQDTPQVADRPEDTDEPEQTEVLSPALIAEQLSFNKEAGLLWPISGEVIIPYSPDHGVYYQTLDQFSASEAIVLSSAVGTEVKASAKGVVTSIEEDVRTGTTVTLALGNNTSLVYGQLDVTDLKEGDVLEAGDCIGTVAEPTRYYIVEGPNLYFKVLEGEDSIDPSELLKNE